MLFQNRTIEKMESVEEKGLEARKTFKGGSQVPKMYSLDCSLIID